MILSAQYSILGRIVDSLNKGYCGGGTGSGE